MKRVAIQGVPGAFHEIAARSYFKDEEIEVVACETFKDLFGRLAKDSDMIGIVAIENTIAGSLLQNHHLLNDSGLCVVGEYKLRIVHNLVALKGQRVEDRRYRISVFRIWKIGCSGCIVLRGLCNPLFYFCRPALNRACLYIANSAL